jgi:hypothetical protein
VDPTLPAVILVAALRTGLQPLFRFGPLKPRSLNRCGDMNGASGRCPVLPGGPHSESGSLPFRNPTWPLTVSTIMVWTPKGGSAPPTHQLATAEVRSQQQAHADRELRRAHPDLGHVGDDVHEDGKHDGGTDGRSYGHPRSVSGDLAPVQAPSLPGSRPAGPRDRTTRHGRSRTAPPRARSGSAI